MVNFYEPLHIVLDVLTVLDETLQGHRRDKLNDWTISVAIEDAREVRVSNVELAHLFAQEPVVDVPQRP